MKKFSKVAAVTAALSLISSVASAATTATGTANARVVTPIAVSTGTALEFGSFTSSGSSGTITQAGAVTGGVTAISSGATRAAGTFSVTGENSTGYTFTLPSSVTLTSGGNNMSAALSFASGTSSRTLSAGGSETVSINGTLTVAANQATGTYTGTYNVTVSY